MGLVGMVSLEGDRWKGLCTEWVILNKEGRQSKWTEKVTSLSPGRGTLKNKRLPNDLEHGHWGDNSRSPEGETVQMGTIFLEERYYRGVTVEGWGITEGAVITVGEIDITVGTLVVTVEKGWFVTVVGAW